MTKAEEGHDMRLDRTLVREIRAANGDGSREAKFELLHKIDEARKEFSTPEIVTTFAEISRRHGRAVTAICVAATLWARRDRLDGWQLKWAELVLELWTTKPSLSHSDRAAIDDGVHPTRICEYAASFINGTTEY